MSTQIAQLEGQLGEKLFIRQGRTLALTEAGRIALSYAESIFKSGTELVATLRDGREREHLLCIGALATLSRNFQESFVRPLLGEPHVRLRLISGSLDDLLGKLRFGNTKVTNAGDLTGPWNVALSLDFY